MKSTLFIKVYLATHSWLWYVDFISAGSVASARGKKSSRCPNREPYISSHFYLVLAELHFLTVIKRFLFFNVNNFHYAMYGL